MTRYVFGVVSLIWGSLIIIIGLSLYIASIFPSQGTVLITNDLLLNNNERFHLYDISREQSYKFTPQITDEALFVSLAPRNRRMAVLNVELNRFSLDIVDLSGNILLADIPVSNSLDFDEAHWSSDGRYFMYYDGTIIFIVDIETREIQEIAIGEVDEPSASWTRDRSALAFTYWNEADRVSQIWLADENGANKRPLTYNENNSYCPVWSPDGETVVYLEDVAGGERLNYITVENGEEPDYPSGIWRMTTCPLWSNNGDSILFINLDGITRRTMLVQLNIHSGQIDEIFLVNQTVSLQLWR